jgi:hypothetical protein
VARIDSKLATVETSILEQYERQLLQLADLNVPTGFSTGTYFEKGQDPASEEEDRDIVYREQKSRKLEV